MSLAITKPSIDIGIVCKDIDAMMTFYGETLGLPLEATIPMPAGSGEVEHLDEIARGRRVVRVGLHQWSHRAPPAPDDLVGR